MKGHICGTGAYAPSKVIDNQELSKLVDTNDEWIQERTGIRKRHFADVDDTVSMAVKAARRALQMAKMDSSEIDLILVSTFSPKRLLPCTACEVQRELGAFNSSCFDLNAACTGFLYAYNTAQAYIEAGLYKTVLVIGSETLSHLVDYSDRSTCILFGDGAGAVLIKAEGTGIFSMVSHSEGKKGEALTCSRRDYIKMNGQEVFKFAVRSVPDSILELLRKNNMDVSEIDYFILHQANKRIVQAVAKRLGVEIEKFPMNLEEYGNTSSASIPLVLDEWNRKGMLKPGMRIVMAGFGAGLSWGATLTQW